MIAADKAGRAHRTGMVPTPQEMRKFLAVRLAQIHGERYASATMRASSETVYRWAREACDTESSETDAELLSTPD